MIAVWLSVAHAGTWLLHESLVVEVKPPVFFKWTESTTELWSVVDWEPGADHWSARLCTMEGSPVLGARTSWARERIATTGERRRPVAFDGSRFTSGPVSESIGTGDDDHDGQPGISIQVAHPRIGSGEVFVRQQVELAWTGVLGADGRITGTVAYDQQQEQLGATTWWLRRPMEMRTPAVGRSTFELSPLPDGATCDTVR